MTKRKSDTFLWYVAANICVLLLLFTHAFFERKKAVPHLTNRIRMVHDFQLTDLSLFTEARYTRHPSMADLNTAFQDHPLSLEHFPSGSLVNPPRHLTKNGLD
jgi:hypothetical protein